jgi:hypothetical protein
MNTIANRIFVIAASVIALGTMAYGQNRMTAEVPFAFHTATGTLPAGTYEFTRGTAPGMENIVAVRSAATLHSNFIGHAVYNVYSKAHGSPVAEFTCIHGDSCTLTAVRTWSGSYECAAPRKPKDVEKNLAVVSIPLKPVATD